MSANHRTPVYVAGKTQDYELVRTIQKLCTDCGWCITHDWTKTVEAKGPADRAGHMPMAEQSKYAKLDLQGVYQANLIVAVGNPEVTGTLIELGAALAWGKPIWTYQWEKVRYTIFNALPNFTHFGSDIEALARELRKPHAAATSLSPHNQTFAVEVE